MPREVFLAPGGSPFVQNNNTRNDDADTSLPDMSSRYFRANANPEDLNSSGALAGLDDISADMAEDESPMRFRASVSDELLMGVNGGEFLADDSAMGFDTSLVAKPFDSRPKLMDSTSIPPAVSEEPEEEKPKRKNSFALQIALEEEYHVTQNLEPEAEPEPETKPRRTSPRKARTTRTTSSTEPPPAFSITPSSSTSNPFSSPPVADSTPTAPSEHAGADVQAPQTTKPKRTSRTAGRSKSKTRSKNMPAEVEEEPSAEAPAALETISSSPPVDQRISPPAEVAQPPTFSNKYLDIANEHEPKHVLTESAPTSSPFKFQTRSLARNSRSKSLTPPVSSNAPVAETSSPDPSAEREPTEEEEAEAVASALRILRRDSSIFPRLRQSIAPSPTPILESEAAPTQDEAPAPVEEGAATEVQAEPIHKRTRVGRASTRARGGSSAAGRSRMDQVAEEEAFKSEVAAVQVEAPAVIAPEGQAGEDEPTVTDDIAVPVNFGSRTPSPVPAPVAVQAPPQPEPEPEVVNAFIDSKPARAPRTRSSTAPNTSIPPTGTKSRVTRASLPAQTARVTRTTRMSEGRLPSVANTRSTKSKEPELVEENEEQERMMEEEPAIAPNVDASAPAPEPLVEEAAQSVVVPCPATPAEPDMIAQNAIEAELEPKLEQAREPTESSPTPAPVPAKPAVQRKALGASDKGGPQRVPTTSQKPPSKTGARTASGQRTASGTQKPPSKTTTTTGAVSKVATTTARKASPATQKPPSTSGPTRVSVSQSLPKSKDDVGARPTRTLPKRASATSREQESMETLQEELATPAGRVVIEAEDHVMDEPVKEPAPEPIRAGPFEHKRPAFQPILTRADSSSELSSVSDTSPPRPNKRRASPEAEVEQPVLDSPSKRVRFSADLEAGPTPRAGPSQTKPKPSIKPFAKPSFQLKASRPKTKAKPKRTLTRSGATPSYAAPLKRNVSETAESEAEATGSERPPLSESRANTRSVTNKLKPTVPVEFTFRSDLRMKPPVETPLPNAIPVALPMPDFAAAHAAAEAANLARRERAQAAFLAAQAELESFRTSKHMIGGETARRAAERAVFDAAMKVKEAEAERLRVEEKRLADEREAAEIKEMRKRMVPKANPVPEWYNHIGRNENGSEGIEA
ncbi:proteoglycan 4 [Ceratobasidium sp. AG-Ba]|nr:proteoglycan 4 [Ceratobasidium sp. AG-Ba]